MNPAISRPGTWSARLWQEIEPTYAAILAHPFLTGLTDGTLDRGAFGYYVIQDVHYLGTLHLIGVPLPRRPRAAGLPWATGTVIRCLSFARGCGDQSGGVAEIHGRR